jgi:c-di-GMP-binding flagellar brake protein YcgR
MSQSPTDLLEGAVARNAAVVLSLPSAGMLRHHKSRFLCESPEGVWLESIPSEHPLIKDLIVASQACGVSFKLSDKKISFTTRLIRHDPEFRINGHTLLQAVLTERPTSVKAIQRRHNYRVKVSADAELMLRAWRIPEHQNLRDRPSQSAELAAKLRDLSVGGIGLLIGPRDGQAPKISEGERVRIALKRGDAEELLLEGRIRKCLPHPSGDGSIDTGVQFVKLQEGVQGRQILSELTKIVGGLQLEEVRRHRLGL